MRRILLSLASALLLAPLPASAQAAPAASGVPTTRVLAIGHITREASGMPAESRRAIMPQEVKATVNLYLAGKIDQWFVRQDGQGVVFLLNATSTAEAEAMLADLPLAKAHRMSFDLMPLGPLSPLRFLMGDGASAPDNH